MIKNFLSRMMGTTKRKRSGAKRQRGLAFEQMEDRLALSTTTGTDIDLRSYSMTTSQGGSIAFDAVTVNRSAFLELSGKSYLLNSEATTGSTADYRDADYWDFEDPLFIGDADSLNSWHSNVESKIPQPTFGNVENSNGIVAIGAIFENQSLAKGLQDSTNNVAIARPQASPELAPAIVPVNEVSLSRGREMYFDVAEVSSDESSSRQDENDQTTLTRVSFNSLAKEREQVRTASKNVPANNSTKVLPGRGTQTDAIRTSVPSEAVLNAAPKVSEAELPELPQENSPQGEKVSATSARDQAFAEWRRREFLNSDDILSARTDESDEDSSSWPILAALAVGGLVVRSRRSANRSVWHQQPPRRKKSAIL